MNYGVFVISHGRPDKQHTLKTLRDCGYTRELYLVLDDEDDTYPLYHHNLEYCDDILQFKKQTYIDKTDTVTADKKRSSPVYARNCVEEYANDRNYDAYIIMDDDIQNLRYRWVEDGSVKSLSLTQNLDDVLDNYIAFMLENDISATSFSNVMLYVGGSSGVDNRIMNNREMYQIHMRNLKFPVEWKSIINNDTITELMYSRMGYHIWSLPFVIYDSPKMNTLPGGMKSVYDSLSEFNRAFMATVVMPSVCRPVVSNGHIVIGRSRQAAYPKVISGRYKK